MSKKMVVECIETGEQFPSIVEAARAKGCSAPNISKALQKGTIAAGGHWRYKFPKSEVISFWSLPIPCHNQQRWACEVLLSLRPIRCSHSISDVLDE